MLADALMAKALLPPTTTESRELLLHQAITEYREGIRCNKESAEDRTLIFPQAVAAHRGLGDALLLKGRLEDARAEYQKAISLPALRGYPGLRFGETSEEFREATHLDKGDAAAVCIIGDAVAEVLTARGQQIDAIGMYVSISWATKNLAEAYTSLGKALQARGERENALAAFRQAARLDKDTARVHCRCASLRLANGYPQHARSKYREALRIYKKVFAADPRSADEPRAQHRYTAACAAARVGTDRGTDTAGRRVRNRQECRRLALRWLRADLDAWDQFLKSESGQDRSLVIRRLQHWQQARELAGVRDKEALATLPEGERSAWQQLWADVGVTLDTARKQAPAEQKSSPK